MLTIHQIVERLIELRQQGIQLTLLAVCPNSQAVLEAAVKAAATNHAPMLFAATLNQVDRDGGYTGWTALEFVSQLKAEAKKNQWEGPLYPCLDHGGPWLKDRHTLSNLSYEATTSEVKKSITACLEAGYQLLHIDVTIDRDLPPGEPVPLPQLIQRTVELIEYSKKERLRLRCPPIAYEVGSEEVHGGLVDFHRFREFLLGLQQEMSLRSLSNAWPVFIVTQVGTDLHTTQFDPQAARQLYQFVSPLHSLIKGHYTDWVENPFEYPASGMGAANVGPEFTAEEFLALLDLAQKEKSLCRYRKNCSASDIGYMMEEAVMRSGRWKKWLLPEEAGLSFYKLSPQRRAWLTQTGARYIWTDPAVMQSRQHLYENLSSVLSDPHRYVIARIESVIDKYINAFNLFASLDLFCDNG